MSADAPSLNGEFLTVAQVAEILQLNQQTVRNWIDQGSLPAYRVGRRVRIQRSDLEQIIVKSRTSTRAAAAPTGPSAEDFWGGTPVGLAEPAPGELPVGLAEPAPGQSPVGLAEPALGESPPGVADPARGATSMHPDS